MAFFLCYFSLVKDCEDKYSACACAGVAQEVCKRALPTLSLSHVTKRTVCGSQDEFLSQQSTVRRGQLLNRHTWLCFVAAEMTPGDRALHPKEAAPAVAPMMWDLVIF